MVYNNSGGTDATATDNEPQPESAIHFPAIRPQSSRPISGAKRPVIGHIEW